MTPVAFPESNKTLKAPPGKEAAIIELPVYTDGEQCISCYRLSWAERWSALFFGRAWLSVLSGQTQPPVWVLVRRKLFGPPVQQAPAPEESRIVRP